MNYTNSSTRSHVICQGTGAPTERVLSLELTKHGLRLCVRKPATLARRHGKQSLSRVRQQAARNGLKSQVQFGAF